LRNLGERCKINRKLIKQDKISRSKQDLFRELKIYFVLLHIFHPFLLLNELHLQRVWAACDVTSLGPSSRIQNCDFC